MPPSVVPDPHVRVRTATVDDAAGCRAVYAPFVTDTVVTLEEQVPTVEVFGARIAAALRTHDWLVATDGDRVLGYAYAGPVRERSAYRWSCEVSIYLAPDAHGRGLGRRLYGELFDRLVALGMRRMVAVVTLPNPASVGLHTALGFRGGPVLERIGFKHGRWVDVAWLQADLGGGDALAPPVDLVPPDEPHP